MRQMSLQVISPIDSVTFGIIGLGLGLRFHYGVKFDV